MSLLGGLFWMLAGGSYVAGGLAKDHVLSQGHQYSDIVHDMKWYEKHALELNHDRQEELFKLYKENLPAFEALSGRKEINHRLDMHSMTGGRWGGYFDVAASGIARQEGWIYDHDCRLNETRRKSASGEMVPASDICKQLVKAKRERYENSPMASQIPYIGDNNNWWIGDVDTGFSATLKNCPSVSENLVWKFGQTITEYSAPYFIRPPLLQSIYISRPGEPDNPNCYNFYSAPTIFEKDGSWFVKKDKNSNKVFNMALSVADGVERPRLMGDGYFWYNGERTRLKISPLRYSPNFRVSVIDNETWTMEVCLELEEAPYSKYTATGDSGTIGFLTLNTGIPVVRFHKLQLDTEIKSELMALTDATWIGWSQETEELRAYCEQYDCMEEFSDFIGCRQNKDPRFVYPSICADIPYGSGGEKSQDAIINAIIRGVGRIPYKYDFSESQEKLEARVKAHRNPAKLNEWSNLVFDLVNGEEHIRANEPGRYEELLEKFKGITGEDFTRGVNYLNTFRRLAIEDGWYIPEENDDWFLNPAPPEPVETYGCSELPTRYQ